MLEDERSHMPDVLREDEGGAIQGGPGLGGALEVDGAARADAQFQTRVAVGRDDQAGDVLSEERSDLHRLDFLLHFFQSVGGEDGIYGRVAALVSLQDLDLAGQVGITKAQYHHEPVHLGARQREGAVLI